MHTLCTQRTAKPRRCSQSCRSITGARRHLSLGDVAGALVVGVPAEEHGLDWHGTLPWRRPAHHPGVPDTRQARPHAGQDPRTRRPATRAAKRAARTKAALDGSGTVAVNVTSRTFTNASPPILVGIAPTRSESPRNIGPRLVGRSYCWLSKTLVSRKTALRFAMLSRRRDSGAIFPALGDAEPDANHPAAGPTTVRIPKGLRIRPGGTPPGVAA